jgi:phage gpG-like protein
LKLLSLLEASAELALASQRMHAVGPLIIEQACRMVHKEARRVLGTYDYGWKKLKSSTVSRKGKDTPGVNTGELRNSIQWTAKGLEGCVGTNNQKGVWFELGTMHQPPRSFLVGALRAKARDIHKMAGQSAAAAMAPHHLLSPEMRAVVHGLKKIGHKVEELREDMLEEDKGHR